MKWTKFSSGELPKTRFVWITDNEEIWIDNISIHHSGLLENAWKRFMCDLREGLSFSEIETPEIPKKELHRCEGEIGKFSFTSTAKWVCEESEGKLTYFESYDDNTTYSEVKFCPFCGYSIKEKE